MHCLIKLNRSSVFLKKINLVKQYCSTNKDTCHLLEENVNKPEEKTKTSKESDNIMPIPIYSKKGDCGKTEFNGIFLSKDDKMFNAIGATDELSSQLGFAKEFGKQHAYGDKLLRIQIVLVHVITAIKNSHCANEQKIVSFSPTYTKELEDWIDEYTNHLPPCEIYVLPGGGVASSALHVARSVCRRAERSIIPLVRDSVIDKEILAYLNRLSDFLFTISRLACKMDKQDEYTTSADHHVVKKG